MDFDKVIDRLNTHSMKWDMIEKNYNVDPKDGIAMWIADMDFSPPQAVADSIKTMLKNQVLGYYGDDKSYLDAICDWMQRRHQWTVNPSWIFTTHGLVNAIALCLQAFSKKDDNIIIFEPVYHMFGNVIKANERNMLVSNLINVNGRYEMDLDALEASLTGKESILLLCSPHNPGGRVWSKQELKNVADFCIKHDILLISDEIHQDLVFSGHKHHVMPLAAPDVCDRLIMLTAATKTFNIAGCLTGNVIISNEKLRNTFRKAATACAVHGHAFGQNMVEAAYNDGEEWLEYCVEYIEENCRIFDEGINNIPGLSSMKLEATYLAWVDFGATGMSKAEIIDRIQNKAKIAASHGHQFGECGKTFMRFNIACSRPVLIEAIERLKVAFSDLQ